LVVLLPQMQQNAVRDGYGDPSVIAHHGPVRPPRRASSVRRAARPVEMALVIFK